MATVNPTSEITNSLDERSQKKSGIIALLQTDIPIPGVKKVEEAGKWLIHAAGETLRKTVKPSDEEKAEQENSKTGIWNKAIPLPGVKHYVAARNVAARLAKAGVLATVGAGVRMAPHVVLPAALLSASSIYQDSLHVDDVTAIEMDYRILQNTKFKDVHSSDQYLKYLSRLAGVLDHSNSYSSIALKSMMKFNGIKQDSLSPQDQFKYLIMDHIQSRKNSDTAEDDFNPNKLQDIKNYYDFMAEIERKMPKRGINPYEAEGITQYISFMGGSREQLPKWLQDTKVDFKHNQDLTGIGQDLSFRLQLLALKNDEVVLKLLNLKARQDGFRSLIAIANYNLSFNENTGRGDDQLILDTMSPMTQDFLLQHPEKREMLYELIQKVKDHFDFRINLDDSFNPYDSKHDESRKLVPADPGLAHYLALNIAEPYLYEPQELQEALASRGKTTYIIDPVHTSGYPVVEDDSMLASYRSFALRKLGVTGESELEGKEAISSAGAKFYAPNGLNPHSDSFIAVPFSLTDLSNTRKLMDHEQEHWLDHRLDWRRAENAEDPELISLRQSFRDTVRQSLNDGDKETDLIDASDGQCQYAHAYYGVNHATDDRSADREFSAVIAEQFKNAPRMQKERFPNIYAYNMRRFGYSPIAVQKRITGKSLKPSGVPKKINLANVFRANPRLDFLLPKPVLTRTKQGPIVESSPRKTKAQKKKSIQGDMAAHNHSLRAKSSRRIKEAGIMHHQRKR